MVRAYNLINSLNPTYSEICCYVDERENTGSTYGVVTYTEENDNPLVIRLHDTWRIKRNGKLHIDIILGEIHLILNKHWASNFTAFLKKIRGYRA